jgi:hypothetical protein
MPLEFVLEGTDAFYTPPVGQIEQSPCFLTIQEVIPLSAGVVEPLAVVVDHSGQEVDAVGGVAVLVAPMTC